MEMPTPNRPTTSVSAFRVVPVSRVYPDSARAVFDAATYAVTDEGIGLALVDQEQQFLESNWVDVSALRHVPPASTETVQGGDRMVRFQFRTERTGGGTRLVGEALVRPTGGGRYADQMAPASHPAREVLARMFEHVTERLGK